MLLEAKRRGLIDRVLPRVDRLVAELRFFASPALRRRLAVLSDGRKRVTELARARRDERAVLFASGDSESRPSLQGKRRWRYAADAVQDGPCPEH